MILPDIVITSYLGSDKELRAKRLKNHIKQREILSNEFPEKLITSICSGYEKQEINQLGEYLTDLGKNNSYTYLKERTPKYVKQNSVLEELYDSKTLKAILFLDDDVIPRVPKPTDLENGLIDTAELIDYWLFKPSQIPSPLMFFSCSGLLFDAYYKSEKSIIGEAPIMVTGWSMLVRSDLGVLHDSYDLTKTKVDDISFRVKAEANNKLVTKHYRAFFRTLQGTNGKNSVVYEDQSDRNKDISQTISILKRQYPQVFEKRKPQKLSNKKSLSNILKENPH